MTCARARRTATLATQQSSTSGRAATSLLQQRLQAREPVLRRHRRLLRRGRRRVVGISGMKRDGSHDRLARRLRFLHQFRCRLRCARVIATYISRRSSSIRSLSIGPSSSEPPRCGMMPSSTPTRNTCGYSVRRMDRRQPHRIRILVLPSSIDISATVWIRPSRFLPVSAAVRVVKTFRLAVDRFRLGLGALALQPFEEFEHVLPLRLRLPFVERIVQVRLVVDRLHHVVEHGGGGILVRTLGQALDEVAEHPQRLDLGRTAAPRSRPCTRPRTATPSPGPRTSRALRASCCRSRGAAW